MTSARSTSSASCPATTSASQSYYPKTPPSLAPVVNSLSKVVLRLRPMLPLQTAGRVLGGETGDGVGARLLQPGRLVDSAGVVDTGVEAQTRLRRVDVGAVDLVEGIEMMIGASHHRAEIRRLHRGETLGPTVETDGLRRAQGVRRGGEDDMTKVCCALSRKTS